MPLTFRDAESAYLAGTAKHKTWVTMFMQQWMQPVQDEMALMTWDTMPQEVHDELEKADPEMYAEAKEVIEKLRAGG